MAKIHYASDQKTVQEIIFLYERKLLNLSPGFQRSSVWTKTDRSKLIDSIVRNYPLPSIFLYRREHEGEIIYDVIDGKQRIETILIFTGMMHGESFHARLQLPDSEKEELMDWKAINQRKLQSCINGYRLQVIEVQGDLSDIADFFVRINSTGKALTMAEKRNANYYNSEFLKRASALAKKFREYFNANGIMTESQMNRMKHVELICELVVAAHHHEVGDKRTALDRVMDTKSIAGTRLDKAILQTASGLKRIKAMFPAIRETRFGNLSDFYTLAVLVQKFEREKLVLDDRKRNKLAWDILVMLSNGVDKLSNQLRRGDAPSESQDIFRRYTQTVREGTDKLKQRKYREGILRELLEPLFERKDSMRSFSQEQRRLLWNSTSERQCAKCREELTWENFTIDHIDPYSKGGRTQLNNAALMCRSCNSGKGNRTVA